MLDLKLVLPVLAVVTATAIVVAIRPGALPAAVVPATAEALPVAPPVAQPVATADWATRALSATGTGSAGDAAGKNVAEVRRLAERGAKLSALRQLARGIGELRTSTGERVDALVDEPTRIAAAQGFRVEDTKYFNDGSVDVIATLPLEVIDAIIAPAVVTP